MNCEKKMKHLEMLQGIITRMGENSFRLKEWTVALVALVGTLSAQGSDKRFIVLAGVPLVTFWLLDSYYLMLERKYRILYKNVTEKAENEVDFSMDLSKIICYGDEAKRLCYCNCLGSVTEAGFYLCIVAVVGILAIILKIT